MSDVGEDEQRLLTSVFTPEMEMAETGGGLPDAADLALDEINPANPHLFKEDRWQEHFTRLRAEDPVHFNELESSGRYWSVTKYDDVKAVDGDWETFSSAKGITLTPKPTPETEALMSRLTTFIAMDPPEHTKQRKTVRAVSAPSHLNTLEPLIRERTAGVLDSLPEGETFDWVDTVSIELTTLLLATLFDFPMEDRRKLTRWSDIVFAVPEPGGIVESQEQKITEILECAGYFGELWEQRRGGSGFDLVTMLANGEATKDMEPIEHLGNLLLLIVGGNDTTRNSMSGSVYGLNKFPEQYDKLVDNHDLVANLVPEIIRWQTPLPYMRRTANFDTKIRDKEILEGDQILMWYASTNRDEDVFENADSIDLERPNADRHLSFGYGIHYCMGSRLAELQLRVLWEGILERFERIEIQAEPDGGDQHRFRSSRPTGDRLNIMGNMRRSIGALGRGRSGPTQRVVVAGMGDAGAPIAVRLARRCDVVGISTRPALVSGQELGTRLADPPRWRASYFVPFSRFRGLDSVRLVHGKIVSVDLDRQEVRIETAGGETTTEEYDWLVISTGASNGFWRHDRVENLAEALAEHDEVENLISSASDLAVIGGGPSGVSVADNLARRGSQEVHLFHSGDLPLPGYHPDTRKWVAGRLRLDGVHVHPNHRAETADGLVTDRITSGPISWSTGQEPFEADATIWAVGRVRPHSDFLPADVLDPDGFVVVDRHLRMPRHPNVFAVGDVAASDPNRSSARNFGYRVVVANLRRLISGHGRKLRAFKAPEHRWGSVFGVQDDGLVIHQPDGRRVRVPRWVAEELLVRIFLHAYLYGTLRRRSR